MSNHTAFLHVSQFNTLTSIPSDDTIKFTLLLSVIYTVKGYKKKKGKKKQNSQWEILPAVRHRWMKPGAGSR